MKFEIVDNQFLKDGKPIKIISGTHMAHSNFRAMPICVGTGEAAGTAAALAVNKGYALCDIDAADIRKIIGI